ncbi:MFS transporter [Nocardia sp. CA2R105]|uniref:MFS transporter n=1 Tax=Nocardia coffeae TaxID=2873381 RepID=UPI001CA5FC8C|nr:MFS transporter [Nocardia coffeae]MBY8863528.1 MFS transporter [Nocardia coffeae]
MQTSDIGASAIPRQWIKPAAAVAAAGWGAQQFTPLLLVYQDRLHLTNTMTQLTFAAYTAGLLPGLLFGGPFSDRFGRKAVMIPTMLAALLASLLLIAGPWGIGWLIAGRLITGVASGAAFSSGAAWLKELSNAESHDVTQGARRLTVAMGIGFALGPLVAGVLAQWAPDRTIVPYIPHLLLAGLALILVVRTPETLTKNPDAGILAALRIREVRDRRFLMIVAPLAPWVFIPVAVILAYVPAIIHDSTRSWAMLFAAIVTTFNAGAGILVQKPAKAIAAHGRQYLILTGFSLVVAGLLLAVAAVRFASPTVALISSLVLGVAYGCLQVCGLLEVQSIADPARLGGLTAVYQALTYIGFAASFVLALLAPWGTPVQLLLYTALLAALCFGWLIRAQRVLDPKVPGPAAAVPPVPTEVRHPARNASGGRG